ncbi:MAG: hypothetical protein KOO62_04140 [candidate division Zixibacteria bacterium]|nr:hypothetical protein [candidate division Zixibacteria bacterium]
MFAMLLKGMLIIFMLAGVVGILYGAWEIWRTVSFVSNSTDKVEGTFVGYHREIHRTTSIRSYSPSNPNMPSTVVSNTVATYPEFAYRTDHGDEQVIRESKVHVFSVYEPGEEVEVLLSSSDPPRMASFYSLYFRDLVILGLGLIALLLALVFWNFALPLFTTPHPVEVYSEGTSPGTDTLQSQDTTSSAEDVFNGIMNEALDFKVGPITMRQILYGFLALMILVIILSICFGSSRT